jgi:hypothetical protein
VRRRRRRRRQDALASSTAISPFVKGGVLHDGVGFTIGHLALFRDLDRPLALIIHGLEFSPCGEPADQRIERTLAGAKAMSAQKSGWHTETVKRVFMNPHHHDVQM